LNRHFGVRQVDPQSARHFDGTGAGSLLRRSPDPGIPPGQAILARHAADPVPSLRTVRSDVPVAIERAVGRALAKAPADRFPTASEFGEALVLT
jgi:serine/threonine-protein kinase